MRVVEVYSCATDHLIGTTVFCCVRLEKVKSIYKMITVRCDLDLHSSECDRSYTPCSASATTNVQ